MLWDGVIVAVVVPLLALVLWYVPIVPDRFALRPQIRHAQTLRNIARLEQELGLAAPTPERVPTIETAIRRYGNTKPIRCDCPSNVKGCGFYGCPRR